MTRTTHRSTAGTKLYAKRTKGQFTDIQTHRRSSRADQRVTTVEEATRVFIREVKPLLASWTGWAHTAKAEAALKALNAATRAAAKRKRGEGMSDLKPWPRCTVCGLRKKPIGRDAAAAAARGNCNHECEGYRLDPQPGYLWRFIAERTPEPKEETS